MTFKQPPNFIYSYIGRVATWGSYCPELFQHLNFLSSRFVTALVYRQEECSPFEGFPPPPPPHTHTHTHTHLYHFMIHSITPLLYTAWAGEGSGGCGKQDLSCFDLRRKSNWVLLWFRGNHTHGIPHRWGWGLYDQTTQQTYRQPTEVFNVTLLIVRALQ